MVLLHVLIAVSSIAFTTFLYFSPSRAGIRAGCVLAALTLTTGTYLVASTGTHILQACLTGLGYLAVVSLGIAMARKKLAAQKVPGNDNHF